MLASCGTFISNTIMVMMIAITPSLKASSSDHAIAEGFQSVFLHNLLSFLTVERGSGGGNFRRAAAANL